MDIVNRYMRERNFTSSDGTPMPYRIYIPTDYDKNESYPLVIFFHGAGEIGSDNRKQVTYPYSIVTRLLTEENRENHECIIIAPQAGGQWVNTPWSEGNYTRSEIAESKYMTAAEELIQSIKKSYSIDSDSVYATGVSIGGFAVWDIISRHPDWFAAAIPVCGGADISYAEKLINMPIWTFHGSADTTVPVEGTREMAEAIKGAGSESIIYTEYENAGHNVWNMAYVEDDLLEWLFSKTISSHTQIPAATKPQESSATETSIVPVTSGTEPENSSDDIKTGYTGYVIAVIAGIAFGAVAYFIIKAKRKNR